MRIAFTGKMRSGKTTAAQWLVENKNYHRYAIADNVKQAASGMMNALDAYIHGGDQSREWDVNEINKFKDRAAIRELLQLAGDGLGRNLIGGSDVWINMLEEQIKTSPYSNIVVDDIRYENEHQVLSGLGFTIVRIERAPEIERRNELFMIYGDRAETMMKHPSEVFQDALYFDEIISASSEEGLIRQVKLRSTHIWK